MVSIEPNRKGWHAVRHRDGWWVGSKAGVTCYENRIDARAAMTILWQREGGKKLNYSVAVFPGNPMKDVGEHCPTSSAVEAINRYERKTNI